MTDLRALVEQLSLPEKRGQAHGQLLKADDRVIPYLQKALREAKSPEAREICAEILGDRKKARAVPDLIEALDDTFFVRQDALWAIEKICRCDLHFWLSLPSLKRPKKLKKLVKAWWRRNRAYIEDNPWLW